MNILLPEISLSLSKKAEGRKDARNVPSFLHHAEGQDLWFNKEKGGNNHIPYSEYWPNQYI